MPRLVTGVSLIPGIRFGRSGKRGWRCFRQEKVMACPTVILGKRKLFILGGFSENRRRSDIAVQLRWQEVPAGEQLKQVARKHPDAVAFGYTRGRWFAAA